MSLTAFKRKSVIKHGSKRSGSSPGGVWLPQGPFGHSKTGLQFPVDERNYSSVGFSINGGHRNVGGVGREMKMSKSGTPYRGTEPIGFGGTFGKYPSAVLIGDANTSSTIVLPNPGSHQPAVEPILNSRIVNTRGTEHLYIKPSVLSTYGMLRKKYRWAYNGQYPNRWVQPNYTGAQSDSASQGLYIQKKASANVCSIKVNDVANYVDDNKKCGPTLCKSGRSTAGFTYNGMARNGPYTKILGEPVSYGEYNLHLTRGCNNPTNAQKPFPYAVQTGTGIKTGGISVSRVGNACGTSTTYLSPPEWYTRVKMLKSAPSNDAAQTNLLDGNTGTNLMATVAPPML